MIDIACIIIAGGRRTALLDQHIMPSVVGQGFDEVLVVGDYHMGEGYRYLCVPKLLGTTVDALVKRDVGTLATSAPVLTYLCDDHALFPDFVTALRALLLDLSSFDVLVPSRWAQHPEQGLIEVNMGTGEGYCGGHAGVFWRGVIVEQPWTTAPHHPNWDALQSWNQQAHGAWFVRAPALRILDLEPEREPWR